MCRQGGNCACRLTGGGPHHRTHLVDADLVGLWKVKLGLLRQDAKLQILHHPDVFDPFHMLFVGVAHCS